MTHPAIRLLCLTLLLPLEAWALASDRDEAMIIEADNAELDDRKGISIYRGNVTVAQGTMTLTGDTVTVYSQEDDIDRISITGNPATYQQQPDGKAKRIYARSLTMEYSASPETITLINEAEVEQDGNILRSDRIVYNATNDQVSAGGSQSKKRVRITLQPKRKSKPGTQ
ncbi:MAG: lipopolysaccharide transport periplasmic protein LptA [Gammaproteobacteria bacterium]